MVTDTASIEPGRNPVDDLDPPARQGATRLGAKRGEPGRHTGGEGDAEVEQAGTSERQQLPGEVVGAQTGAHDPAGNRTGTDAGSDAHHRHQRRPPQSAGVALHHGPGSRQQWGDERAEQHRADHGGRAVQQQTERSDHAGQHTEHEEVARAGAGQVGAPVQRGLDVFAFLRGQRVPPAPTDAHATQIGEPAARGRVVSHCCLPPASAA
ncbi:MAG TPA: hypothetical protein PLV13_10320, partial [Ilumatobacteraceae bacterium]|nr:hypothetical protein [Ilumatobacteraceae bacterium]